MNRKLLTLGAAVVIVVVAFLITTKVLDYLGTPAATTGAPGGILVRSATYGPECHVPAGNVTEKVQVACGGKLSCDYAVDVGKFGDPAPGCPKDFAVEFTCGSNSANQKAYLPGEANGHSVHLACD